MTIECAVLMCVCVCVCACVCVVQYCNRHCCTANILNRFHYYGIKGHTQINKQSTEKNPLTQTYINCGWLDIPAEAAAPDSSAYALHAIKQELPGKNPPSSPAWHAKKRPNICILQLL